MASKLLFFVCHIMLGLNASFLVRDIFVGTVSWSTPISFVATIGMLDVCVIRRKKFWDFGEGTRMKMKDGGD